MTTMTSLENVSLPLEFSGAADSRDRAAAALQATGLDHRLEHYPGQLSGGEQQRVSFARALANDPLIIFADEPTANLDSRNSGSIVDLIESLCRERNTAFAVVTHDAKLRQNADKIIEMQDGLILDA